MFFQTVTKLSVIHLDGKITNGLTDVDSPTVLNAVSAIQRKGTTITKETMIRIR